MERGVRSLSGGLRQPFPLWKCMQRPVRKSSSLGGESDDASRAGRPPSSAGRSLCAAASIAAAQHKQAGCWWCATGRWLLPVVPIFRAQGSHPPTETTTLSTAFYTGELFGAASLSCDGVIVASTRFCAAHRSTPPTSVLPGGYSRPPVPVLLARDGVHTRPG
jgi:hypothetical protein